MAALKALLVRLRALVRRRRADAELDREIAFHLEHETARHIAAGVAPHEARRRALVAFGGVQQTREAHRAVRHAPAIEDAIADARHALRSLVRNPGLAVAAVLTLALGIGANTAVFSVLNAVVLRPLPFAAPDRLFMLWEENPERGWYKQVAAPANFLDWRERVPSFADVGAYGSFPSTFTFGDVPRLGTSLAVTGNLFSVLGVAPEVGRTFRDEETWATGTTRVVILSHRMWREEFGARDDVVGRTLDSDGTQFEVVGVMPRSFVYPGLDVDLWVPFRWPETNRTAAFFRRAHWIRVVARLAPDASPARAESQLHEVARQLQSENPELNRAMGAGMTPLHEFLVGETRRPLLLLLAAVTALLLLACANVGNLLLVRAAEREREVAVRAALGAGRARLVRQAMTESLVLSGIGGIVGMAAGWWGTRVLSRLQPEGMLPVTDISVDLSVLAYVVVVTTVSGLLFGIAPALWNGRSAPADALRAGGRTGTDARRVRRLADMLVVGEISLALLLTVGAGLLVRSFAELRQVAPGFDPAGVVTVSMSLPGTRYDTPDKVAAFYAGLVDRLRAEPGVESAALVRQLPLTTPSWSSDFSVAGRGPDEFGTEVLHREVSADYFRVLGVPLVRGRWFTDADRAGVERVVIINQAIADRYFRGQDPIGQRMAFDRAPDSTSVWRTIVGVVGNEHQQSLAIAPRTEIFAPIGQDGTAGMTLVARRRCGASDGGRCDAAVLLPSIRRVVADLDPRLALGAADVG